MTHLQAIILGIVQGLTEFFPISSSTHLALARQFMGIDSNAADSYFDLICHLGTLSACIAVFRRDILDTLRSFERSALFALALLPLIPAYFLLKPIRPLLVDRAGLFLLAMSALLFFASRRSVRTLELSSEKPKWLHALYIGSMQGLSLLPGFSRSGSTISMARLLGWRWDAAVRFSFLLSIPAILGGSLLESVSHLKIGLAMPWSIYAAGAVSSFVVGIGAIRLLVWILNRGTLRPFAWYCLAVALALCFQRFCLFR